MAGFGDLLGVLMQGGVGSSGTQRVENALGERGLGQSGGFLGEMLGGSGGSGGSGGGLLGNVLGAAGGMLGNAGRAAQENPMAAGGLGAIAGALFGGGSGAIKGAVGGGAMAMLAGLAFQALGNRSSGSPATAQAPLGIRAPATPEEEQELASTADLMFKAMISAAKADGHIDSAEMDKILGKLQEADTDPGLQRLVMEEMHKPLDLDSLIAAIPNEQLAAEVYAASLFAIEVDTPEERDYLQRLAQGSGLDDAVVAQLHQALGVN
jgi:uncharacterized membrane protein YebE (DUF533 family)